MKDLADRLCFRTREWMWVMVVFPHFLSCIQEHAKPWFPVILEPLEWDIYFIDIFWSFKVLDLQMMLCVGPPGQVAGSL